MSVSPAQGAATETDPVILNAADILDELAANIELIGEGLCRDAETAARHAGELQGMDLQAQTARCLAQVLRSDCLQTAVATIGVEALQERLGRAATHAS